MTKETINAIRKESGVHLAHECSRFENFYIEDVNVPEDLHRVTYGREFQIVSLSADGIHFVDLDPVKLRWLYLEAVDRGWYDA